MAPSNCPLILNMFETTLLIPPPIPGNGTASCPVTQAKIFEVAFEITKYAIFTLKASPMGLPSVTTIRVSPFLSSPLTFLSQPPPSLS